MNKKSIAVLSTSVVLCSAVGAVLGWFIGGYFKPSLQVIGSYEIDRNGSNAFEQFLAKNDVKVENISSIDFSSSSMTEKISPADLAGHAIYEFTYETDVRSSLAISNVKSSTAGIDNVQITYSSSFKKDSLVMRENISKAGFVAFAERTYNFNSTTILTDLTKKYDSAYDYYRITGGSNINDSGANIYANYDKKPTYEEVNSARFVETFSTIPDAVVSYQINKDCVTDSPVTLKNADGNDVVYDNAILINKDGNYEVKLSLNQKAIESYAKYITTTTVDASSNVAKMGALPTFNNIGVILTMTRDLKLIQMTSTEDYVVHTSLNLHVPSIAYNTIYFSYLMNTEGNSIPLVGTNVDYSTLRSGV
ncbi:MAG: hypothetical protein H6689_00875 [Erysipelotrichaceae bacterium]|nr:hypothetical protein [Erysipelotrichaceae bacterium]